MVAQGVLGFIRQRALQAISKAARSCAWEALVRLNDIISWHLLRPSWDVWSSIFKCPVT